MSKIFIQYYCRTTHPLQKYSNDIRLQVFKAYGDAINTAEKKKIEKLRKRQDHFLNTIRRTSNYDISELDDIPDTNMG